MKIAHKAGVAALILTVWFAEAQKLVEAWKPK
jgi:hypothetical protein